MTRERILIDTGPIVALLREHDQHHRACVEEAERHVGHFLTCLPVITEVAWLLRNDAQALAGVFALFRDRELKLLPLAEPDLARVQAIMARYADLPAQFADACLMHLAEREHISTVFTLDRRDFQVYRVGRNRPLQLIPSVLK